MPFDIAGALGAGYSAKEITDYLMANPSEAGGFNVGGALKAGYSPEEITDHLNPNVARPSAQGTPILAPIQRGIAHASEGLANLADDLGWKSAAGDIRSRIPQGDLQAPTAAADLSSQLKGGHYGAALTDIPSAALEQALPVAAGVAGGLVTGGVGPVAAVAGRLGGGAAIGAATQGDAIARQRAANNGEAAPSGTDLALGIGGGALTGAAGSVGLGGAAGGLASAAAATLRHGAADAIQPELTSLAGSLGTNAAVQNASPADMAASALTGLGVRGAMGAPAALESARRVVTPSGRQDALVDRWAAMTPDQQQQAVDLAGAAQAVQEAQASHIGLPEQNTPAIAARTAAADLAGKLTGLAGTLDSQGVLPPGGADTIKSAIDAAARPGLALTNGHLAAIDTLGLDPTTTGIIGASLRKLNILSDPNATAGGVGPLESIASGVGGPLAGAALGYGAGSGPIIGAVAGQTFKPMVAGGLGKVGAAADRLIGTSQPSMLSQGTRAAVMLDAAGIKLPNTADGLQAATDASQNAITAQARLMGLPGDYQDAQVMNRQLDQQANQQRALQVADAAAMDQQRTQQQNQQRALEVGDATAMDRQMDQMRALQIGDAQAVDQQRTQAQNFQRAQAVGDAQAMDVARRRLQDATSTAADTVSATATRRAQAAAAMALKDVAASPSGASPEALATYRAAATNPKGPAANTLALDSLSAPQHGVSGLNQQALLHGQLLPDWQWGVGNDVMKALNLRGMSQNLSPAQVSAAAVRSLQDRGMFAPAFADALMGHSGRVVRGVYNLIRNEALLAYGVDHRSLEAQQAGQGAPQ